MIADGVSSANAVADTGSSAGSIAGSFGFLDGVSPVLLEVAQRSHHNREVLQSTGALSDPTRTEPFPVNVSALHALPSYVDVSDDNAFDVSASMRNQWLVGAAGALAFRTPMDRAMSSSCSSSSSSSSSAAVHLEDHSGAVVSAESVECSTEA